MEMMRGADRWLWPLLRSRGGMSSAPVQHVFLAVCDHFEPRHGTNSEGALDRLRRWAHDYPQLASRFADADGRGPRHTFFYPIEQYDPAEVDLIMQICAATGSEIEVQLHHDNDTAQSLTDRLMVGIEQLRGHGGLAVDRSGALRFGFVHGNWALCNSRPDGRWCGVSNELALLRGLGCYADFTFPSAPSPTQPRSVNQIGYARESGSARALDGLRPACVGAGESRLSGDELLLIQGPLALNWSRRKAGLLPRLENADLTLANPPTAQRLDLWIDQRIHVVGRPGWVFVKLHSHGAVPKNSEVLLGDVAAAFHQAFAVDLPRESGAQVHYVTAREMVNVVHAIEDNDPRPAGECLDYWLRPAAAR
jgi:hypothetical protein